MRSPRGFFFEPVGWEETLGGVGRPQTLINEDVPSCDYFVMVFWDRWGSPPEAGASAYSSGTEEEYHVALACYTDEHRPMRQILACFKGVEERRLADPGAELQKVLAFKKKLEAERTLLFRRFDTGPEFGKLINAHLAQWLRDEEARLRGEVPAAAAPATAAPASPDLGEAPDVTGIPNWRRRGRWPTRAN